MKALFVDGLVPNEPVTTQFLVVSKEIRQKKTGEPYLTLHLADRTGEIEAKMWDNVVEVMHTFDRDHFVKVKGLPQVYQNRSQFVIHKLRRLEDHEVDFGDFFPCSERNPDEMFAELTEMIAGMQNPHLRTLLQKIFADPALASAYKLAPAAKSIHHACRGGLLEHVLSLAALARFMASHYPEIDLDLLLTGVILHDIGKVEELTYARSFGYSAEGQLLGHIVLGLRYVGATCDQLPEFPARLRMLVEHMVISHHGELEFGSPKLPMFPEALLLHQLDNLDSKMNTMRNAFRRDAALESEFTGWVAPLERVLLKRPYMKAEAEQAASASSAAPAVPLEPEVAPLSVASDQTETPSSQSDFELSAVPSPAPPAATEPAHSVHPGVPHPETPHPAPAYPKSPAAPPSAPRKADTARPPVNTLFGDKLQAVLEGRK
jgi:3'-5' exoribonuclease